MSNIFTEYKRMMRIIKNLLCITLAALLLLCGCGKTPTQDYCNTREGCLLGETYYENLHLQVWNPNWDAAYDGICRDPLCSHDSEDGLCPSSRQLWMKTLVTDGERLYMNATNPALTDENGTVYRQIFSMKPDGSDFTLLHTYDFSANTSPYMQYADGYLYFEQGFYRGEDSAKTGLTQTGCQAAYVMRIPVKGGKAERVFDEAIEIGSAFYTDGTYNFLLCPDGMGKVQIQITDSAAGTLIESSTAKVEGVPKDITVYDGMTFLQTEEKIEVPCPAENGGSHTYTETLWRLYVYCGGEWEKLGESTDRFAFGGGIWFTESTRLYLGTRSMPTGGPNGETDSVDFYVKATEAFCRINPADGTVTRYTLAGDVQLEDTVTVRCAATSGLWVEVTNGRAEYAGETSVYSCRACLENGGMILHRMDQ